MPMHLDQELFAWGFVNVGVAFFSGYPACGSLSRSALLDRFVLAHLLAFSTLTVVMRSLQAKTQLNNVLSSLVVLLTLLVLTPIFSVLPDTTLAAIIMTAVSKMIDWKRAYVLYKEKLYEDLIAWVLTFLTILIFDIQTGIFMGMFISTVILVKKSMSPIVLSSSISLPLVEVVEEGGEESRGRIGLQSNRRLVQSGINNEQVPNLRLDVQSISAVKYSSQSNFEEDDFVFYEGSEGKDRSQSVDVYKADEARSMIEIIEDEEGESKKVRSTSMDASHKFRSENGRDIENNNLNERGISIEKQDSSSFFVDFSALNGEEGLFDEEGNVNPITETLLACSYVQEQGEQSDDPDSKRTINKNQLFRGMIGRQVRVLILKPLTSLHLGNVEKIEREVKRGLEEGHCVVVMDCEYVLDIDETALAALQALHKTLVDYYKHSFVFLCMLKMRVYTKLVGGGVLTAPGGGSFTKMQVSSSVEHALEKISPELLLNAFFVENGVEVDESMMRKEDVVSNDLDFAILV